MHSILQLSVIAFALAPLACGADDPPPSPPCEEKCQDGSAIRGLRETLKLVFNITLQANPVGPQDESTDCPQGGRARVFGEATSNPVQGATIVDLTYELDQCHYLQRDDEADENYDLTTTGTVLQTGTLVVQPSSTSALIMTSESITLSGTVYDPPIDFVAEACAFELGQNGNKLSGTFCGRIAGVQL